MPKTTRREKALAHRRMVYTHELKLTTEQLALLFCALQSYSNCPREDEGIAIEAMEKLKLALGQEPTPQTLTERMNGA